MRQDLVNIKGKNFILGQIKTEDDLRQYFEKGLGNLYTSVFADPPYCEKFNDGEDLDIFKSYVEKDARIYVLALCDDTPVAFMVATRFVKEAFNNATGFDTLETSEKTAYIADDGVAKPFRRMGLSSYLKAVAMQSYADDGYNTCILRTSIDNEAQIKAVSRSGGRRLENISQDVERMRLDGSISTEKSNFFVFDIVGLRERQPQL